MTIELENLDKTYPRQPHPVLRGVSLVVQPGEMLTLLGPSGSGKSTILKLIAGIEAPDRGDIRFDGKSVLRVPANRRSAVLMFQKAYLFPFATAADNIGFGLKVKGERKQAIRTEVVRMLEMVELPGIERRYPAQLSGGEQQRVALARALITRPRVLLLDEPLSSLDTAVRHTLQEMIRRIQREMGITTLLVTHDLQEAMAMSDRTALLLGGTIAACNEPGRLFENPPTRTVARFVGVSTFLEGEVHQRHLHTRVGAFKLVAGGKTPMAPRPATFAIRPERLRLLEAPAPNAVAGIIETTIYKGEFTEYGVAVDGQQVRARSYQPAPPYQRGDMVYVLFPPEHLFEVREE